MISKGYTEDCVEVNNLTYCLHYTTLRILYQSSQSKMGQEALKSFGLYSEFVITNKMCFSES